MLVCSVEIISRLHSHKFQVFTLFPAAMLAHHGGSHHAVSRLGSVNAVNVCETFRLISEFWENAQT